MGRPRGSPNKATALGRQAIGLFVDANAHKMQGWLDEIARTLGPLQAFHCVLALLEFHVPKLARTEHTGKDGGVIQVARVVDEMHPERPPDMP